MPGRDFCTGTHGSARGEGVVGVVERHGQPDLGRALALGFRCGLGQRHTLQLPHQRLGIDHGIAACVHAGTRAQGGAGHVIRLRPGHGPSQSKRRRFAFSGLAA